MNEHPNLPSLLNQYRIRMGLSQIQLAQKLGQTQQATVSAWERGKQRPNARRLKQLVAALDLDETEENRLYRAHSKMSGRSSNDNHSALQMVKSASHEARNLYGEGKFDIWLIGPTGLPIADDSEVRARWVENLKQGVNYWLVWFVDFVDTSRYQGLVQSLKELEESLSEDSLNENFGRVFHVPLLLEHNLNSLNSNRELLNSIRSFRIFCRRMDFNNQKRTNSGINQLIDYFLNRQERLLQPLENDDNVRIELTVNKQLSSTLRSISIFWMRNSALAVYLPRDSWKNPIANFRLPPLRQSRRESEHRNHPMFWFGEEDEEILGELAKDLERIFTSQIPEDVAGNDFARLSSQMEEA